ncbi:MAG: chromosome segregation protein SMC [bacterium]
MRLNRLELQGFKSFADRTVFNFGGQHLLGIVGPNGCGKSNVVDAVRWVLGETRPTSMRGEGMTDVIFKGSASRPEMSVAEVTLVIDNSDGVVEEMGVEFSITRMLYKSGEGEYHLDGSRVRLKDVRELLYGTGLGSRGYSVLEQGRIDAVLSANPAQRRTVFEEAAGISRYRQRRHETGLRLKSVEQDVSRLTDLMGELRTRVRSLKIQAGKAERWVAARDEWTLARGRFLQHRLHEQDTELAALFPELETLEASQEALRAERSAAEEQVSAQEEERSRVVAELDSISTQVGGLNAALATLDERKTQLALRVQAWRGSAEEESERAQELASQISERRAQQEAAGKELVELEVVAREAAEEAAGLKDRVNALSRSYKQARQDSADQNELLLACLHERTGAQNRTVHMETAIGDARERLGRATKRLGQVDGEITGARSSVKKMHTVAVDAQQTLEGRDKALAAALSNRAAAEEALQSGQSELREHKLAHASLVARREALLESGDGSGGLAAGARCVLQAVADGGGPCTAGTLHGLLADHLHVEVRLARALDAVLGEKAHALLAPGAEEAQVVLEWLASGEHGQAEVLVPKGMGSDGLASALGSVNLGRFDSPSFLAFEPYGASVEGRLSDLVQCAEDLRPLVDNLVGDVVVVRDFASALDLIKREPHWRYVTPSGELVDASGAVGGSRELAQGTMGRRSMAEELGSEMETLEQTLVKDRERINQLAQAVESNLLAHEEATHEREAARGKAANASGEAQTASARLTDQEAVREEHAGVESRAREELAALATDLQLAQDKRIKSEQAFTQTKARLDEVEKTRRGMEEEREALSKAEAKARVETTRLQGELEALRGRVADSMRRCEEDQAERVRAEGRSANFLANADQGERDAEALTLDGQTLATKKDALEARLGELRELERSGAARTREVRAEAEDVQRNLDQVVEEQSEKRLCAQKVELAREELLIRADEDLSLQASDLREDFEPEAELAQAAAMQALEERVSELKATLEKLGPVNTEAVDELAEVEGRLGFLETQSEDLATSRKTLMDTIEKIDEESRRLFEETFAIVRENFRTIFRQLFGGGQADVMLEEGVDVLEGGVEIVARPPGRKSLSIGLLSGGQRSMTALALLFAVFKTQPSPFCVLDEVDAALDDANIDRFLGMLNGFATTTQFIVVTHNKGTMSACQSLFGVTMEVKGVSRFVSVELDDVEEFAPGETTGTSRPGADAMDEESREPVVEIVPASPTVPSSPESVGDSVGVSSAQD